MSEPNEDREARVVEARLKLMERWRKEMEGTPSVGDGSPLGSGSPNRHGMPRVPVGQRVTTGWPVLDLKGAPAIDLATWRLEVTGACARPVALSWEEFRRLAAKADTSDFHCVTGWSKMDIVWEGVLLADILALASPADDASHILCHSFDGYTTNLAMEEALKPDVLVAHTVSGTPLPPEHGGPARLVTPQLYAWKGAKWLAKIELLSAERLGYWEMRGYSSTAHPWRNDRYARRKK